MHGIMKGSNEKKDNRRIPGQKIRSPGPPSNTKRSPIMSKANKASHNVQSTPQYPKSKSILRNKLSGSAFDEGNVYNDEFRLPTIHENNSARHNADLNLH